VIITTGLIDALDCKETFGIRDFEDLSTKDKLAAVLSHELVHANAGHGAMKMQLGFAFFIAAKAARYVLPLFIMHRQDQRERELKEKYKNDPDKGKEKLEEHKYNKLRPDSCELIGQVSELAVNIVKFLVCNRYSCSQEFEADAHGIDLVNSTGSYSLLGALWIQKMFIENKIGCHPSKYFSTHPPSKERYDANQTKIQDIPKKQ
jgi:Zn-dependent protease with chaperone function